MRNSPFSVLLGVASLLGVTAILRSRSHKKSKKCRIVHEDVCVPIERGRRAKSLIKDTILKTYNAKVLPGEFTGIYQISENQALALSIDKIGTKTKFLLDHLERKEALAVIGYDIVNHCVNDILVHNARPIAFIDYISTHRIEPEEVSVLVSAMAKACREVGCVLIGGKTTEMPAIYSRGSLEIMGSVTGIVRLDRFIDGVKSIKEGDVVLGFQSHSPHINNYALLSRLYRDIEFEEDENCILHALTSPHRCYINEITRLECSIARPIHGLVHLTSGGWNRNIQKILPEGLNVVYNTFEIPQNFQDIQRRSGMTKKEMLETFNCGIGMMAVLCEDDLGIATLQGWKYLGRVVSVT